MSELRRGRVIKEEERVTLDVEWSRPTETHGPLLGYRLRYGRVGHRGPLKEVNIRDNTTQYRRLSDLGESLIGRV